MTSAALLALDAPADRPSDVPGRIFTQVPLHHGVAVLDGIVAVYDEGDRRELEEGAFYVVEYQRPRAGMSWEMHRRLRSERVDTKREVVRVERCPWKCDHWITRHAHSHLVDGPWPQLALTDRIVGRVVGLYVSTAPN